MSEQLFDVRADTFVAAPPGEVYATVSDLTRSGEWSVECVGGEWIEGSPGTVGAVFRGDNLRPDEVVAWAPVVRGRWSTTAEVVTAEPDRVFAWAMRDSRGRAQESVWSFEVEPVAGGSRITHAFRMGRPTEGIRGITADMDEPTRVRFFDQWSTKIASDLAATVERVKTVIEKA